jgi:hypothetical protein
LCVALLDEKPKTSTQSFEHKLETHLRLINLKVTVYRFKHKPLRTITNMKLTAGNTSQPTQRR